jgi:hypothetical protein
MTLQKIYPLLSHRLITYASELAGKRCFLRGPRRLLRTQQWIQQQRYGVFCAIRTLMLHVVQSVKRVQLR